FAAFGIRPYAVTIVVLSRKQNLIVFDRYLPRERCLRQAWRNSGDENDPHVFFKRIVVQHASISWTGLRGTRIAMDKNRAQGSVGQQPDAAAASGNASDVAPSVSTEINLGDFTR